jgi:hypothetical protein
MSRMLEMLPPYERNSIVFQEIMKAEEKQFNKMDADIKDLENQLSPDTATWGLSIYEKELGLQIEPDISIEMRRSLIKAKLLMQPPSSKAKFIEILKSFIETAEIEEIFNDYSFNVILKTLDTVGDKLPYIQQVIEDFKPAHLAYIFIICYLYYPKVFIEFQKYFSEKFKVAGTEDMSGNEYISTLGKSYKDKTLYTFNKWHSFEIPAVSETKTIQNRGNSYNERFIYKLGYWTSSDIPTTSQKTTIENLGSTYKSKLSYNLQSSNSKTMRVCSKSTFTREVVA